ncbi:thioredoxin-like protein [Xylaria sp. CBS 124048]|nr:thioredoxin-like protein [Xylaria sp. CBS 124048]
MTPSKIVFFDLARKEPRHTWSLNPWKTRLLLNFKGLDYETEWLEFPEIEPRLQPHFPNEQQWTVPAVKLPDGRWVMDSWNIAQELEKLYPTPAVVLDSPIRQRYLDVFDNAFREILPSRLLDVHSRILSDVSKPFWRETRESKFGATLEELNEEYGDGKAWKAASPYLQQITALLKENNEGPLFLGKQFSFTDAVHAGFLILFRVLGDDLFQQLLEATGDPEVHLEFLKYLEPYTVRDSY